METSLSSINIGIILSGIGLGLMISVLKDFYKFKRNLKHHPTASFYTKYWVAIHCSQEPDVGGPGHISHIISISGTGGIILLSGYAILCIGLILLLTL